MKIDVIQTSFAAGEFGPSLYGRTDIAQYANACQLVENMLPRSYGPAISMPGTRYVATVSDSTLKTRLIPFIFNKTDAYAIEMGDLYMRFFTNRGQVTTKSGTEDLTAFGSDLIAQWKLNDNAGTSTVVDTQTTHNGTASTLTSSLTTTAIISTGFNMQGLYTISVADHANFTRTASTQPMTILAWVYYSDNGTAQMIFTKASSAFNVSEYRLFVSADDKLAFDVYDAVTLGRNIWYSNTTFTEGWNFVAAVFHGDGTNQNDLTLYINGVAVTSTFSNLEAGYVKMANTATEVQIGGQNGVTTTRWQSKLDNIAFFHIALTAAQVASLYTTAPYQITTVYRETDVFDVKFTQLNDVIWLTHRTYPPQKLIRTSANEWTISNAPIIGGPFLDDNTPVLTSSGVSASTITITASATTGTVNLTVSPTTASLFTVSGGTLGHHNSYWMLGGLVQTNSTTGLQEVGYVRITHVINSYTATATVIKNIKATSTVWAEGAFSAVRGYPASVIFHERRLFYARTNYQPENEWGSKIFDFDNFGLDTETDDDGLNLRLASNESNEIQWLASGKSLLAGTFGGVFVTNSGSTDPITPDNATASEEVGFGSSPISPKKIGNFLYYLQRFTVKLREMFFNFDTDTFKAVDRTILSPHILGGGVVDMDVQRNPENILYCVLTNGTLATMTRETDQEVTAWARHTTAGTYTSIAIIPSQTAGYDEAWVIVERFINGAKKKYVEFFEDIAVPARQDLCLYLHSALTYNAYNSTSTSAATISLSASSGSVTLTSSTAYFNGGMIGKRIRAIDENGNTLGQGQITATASTTSITLSITTTFNALSYSAGRWGVSVATVSGLSHLEAKTVGILADGLKESLTRTIASAAVTLASDYWVISVGLSYDQILYTLPKEAGSQRGTSQGKIQRYNEIGFKVNRSTQDFKYGTDASNLDDVNAAFTPTVTTLYTGILPPQGGAIGMRGGYFRGAQVYIKNSNPLPIEILSIMGALDTNDK